jgi:hypothetical protein
VLCFVGLGVKDVVTLSCGTRVECASCLVAVTSLLPTAATCALFGVDGEFIRHVGVGVLSHVMGSKCIVAVAASAFDELVVADTGNSCLRVFSATGDLLATVGDGRFSSVAVHGGTVFAVHEIVLTATVFVFE